MISELLEMLTYRRPHASRTEREFNSKFIKPLEPKIDGFGNMWVTVDDFPLLWCSHVDTVHRIPGKQKVNTDKRGFAFTINGSCLGADDAAGVWIMMQLIRKGIPGTYIFHRAEERGGRGSEHIWKNNHMTDFKWSIALDRRGVDSLVTHQMRGVRGCSDEFADYFSQALDYVPDPTGSFTDNAHYFDEIPENVNLSTGYYKEHTPDEILDLDHVQHLLELLLNIDYSKLPCKRDPDKWDDPGDSLINSYARGTISWDEFFSLKTMIRKAFKKIEENKKQSKKVER